METFLYLRLLLSDNALDIGENAGPPPKGNTALVLKLFYDGDFVS